MSRSIRLARVDDAMRIAEIYAPAVALRPTSFELRVPDAADMAARIDKVLRQWPWLVWTDARGVQGYAYASAYAERVCYQWSVTVSVYVDDAVQRGGIGRALYGRLFEMLRRQGVAKAWAGITLPNDASIGLHRALGFEDVGVYRRVGYKFGAWHDVAWLGLELQRHGTDTEPAAPRALPEMLAAGDFDDLIGPI